MSTICDHEWVRETSPVKSWRQCVKCKAREMWSAISDATAVVQIPDFAGTFTLSSEPTPAPSEVPDYGLCCYCGEQMVAFECDAKTAYSLADSEGFSDDEKRILCWECLVRGEPQREIGREEERARIARILGLSPEALAHLADGPPDLTQDEVEHGRRLIEEGRREERARREMHFLPACRRCIECPAQAHHWMECLLENDDGEVIEPLVPVWGCKHCDFVMPWEDHDDPDSQYERHAAWLRTILARGDHLQESDDD